jgi:hypothetical protein
MWAPDIVGEAIAGQDLDAAAVLLEIGNAVGLEQDLDEWVFARSRPRDRMGNPMLADLDLAKLQPRDRREVDSPFERGGFQGIDIELAAKIGQCI